MALLNCTECGRQISERASKCPGCGNPNEPRRGYADSPEDPLPSWIGKFLIVLAVFVVGCFLNPSAQAHQTKIRAVFSEQHPIASAFGVGYFASSIVSYHQTAIGLASYTEIDNKIATIGFFGMVFVL